MNRHFRSSLTAIIFIAALLLAATHAQAKHRVYVGDGNLHYTRAARGIIRAGEVRGISAAEIEKRFKPFLEARVSGKHGRNESVGGRPSQRDYALLMKTWDKLSPEFRALYGAAMSIPKHLTETYVSPTGKFKIYYTATDTAYTINAAGDTTARDFHHDRVDTVDTFGFGIPAWRDSLPGSNNVPDYIDMVAFALDSAWSMLIDRFGFEPPLPDSADQYRVYIKNLSGEYGATYPMARQRGHARGYASLIELNSDWSNEDWWGVLGYDKRPYDAVKVTCPHELFHGVQYAMAWSAAGAMIDDFTLAWTEGSAVLMEELAFPKVNDYLQYIRRYFVTPWSISFLYDDDNEYLNSILFKYLYEKTGPRDSIGFVKTVHYNSFERQWLPLYKNIDQASQSYDGRAWAQILNGFHTESYFTGSRARPGRFVTDAEQMREWAPERSNGEVSRIIQPHSVEFIRYTPAPEHPDTLYINVACETSSGADGSTWAASVIVLESGSERIDTIIIGGNGSGSAAIANWKTKHGCVVAVTNASPTAARRAVVTPSGDAFSDIGASGSIVAAPNRVKLSAAGSVRISGGDITEVRIVSPEGRDIGYYSNSAKRSSSASARFEKYQLGAVVWYPDKRLVPGVYYVFARSASSNKKGMQRRKVLILP